MGQEQDGSGERRTTFYTLDLLRGIAAIAVMLWHRLTLLLSPTSAYLAVDLFFLLSGVVVAQAYAKRMAEGWTVRRFMLIRLVRLWPLYMVGTCLGLLAMAWTIANGSPPFWHGSVLKIAIFAVLFLPGVHQWDGGFYPLNPAAWSLFAELAVNFYFAIIYRAGLARFWLVGVLLSVIVLAYEIYHLAPITHGMDFGVAKLPGGLARAWFSFGIGVVIHRAWSRGKVPKVRVPPLVYVALFLALVVFPPKDGIGSTFWPFLVVGLGFPLLVAGAMTEVASPAFRKWASRSGRASYPIYTIHLPAFYLLEAAFRGPQATPVWAYYVTSAIVVAIALPLDRYVDAPIRIRLSRWLHLSSRTVRLAKPL